MSIEKKCDGFTLNLKTVLEKPSDDDFKNMSMTGNIALQYGADFELVYTDLNEKRKNTLGILQFIKPSVQINDKVGDKDKNIFIDSTRKDGTSPLSDYLYGTPNVKINYENSQYVKKLMCEREVTRSIIRDTPRELLGYVTDRQNGSVSLIKAPKVVFYNFVVEIDGTYSIIYPKGVTWSYQITQKMEDGRFVNEYEYQYSELCRADFNQLKLESIFGSSIAPKSYRVLRD